MLNNNLPADAQILPFYLDNGSDHVALIRGSMSSVGLPASIILERHDYPEIIATLQAEALALTACLSSTLKFDGVFTLQAKGDGLVRTLFADITASGALRGYVALDENPEALETLAKAYDPNGPVRLGPIMGDGYIAFTVDQGVTNSRYQGIVELEDRYLSNAAMRWYENSEQLDTVVVCAAIREQDSWQARALVLQRIAAEGGNNNDKVETDLVEQAASDDAWHTARTLLGSLTRDELLDGTLSPESIVFRLFNSMAPHSAIARPVVDLCRCNAEKIEAMLKRLGKDEVEDLADKDGNLEITCEFCKTVRTYHKNSISSV